MYVCMYEEGFTVQILVSASHARASILLLPVLARIYGLLGQCVCVAHLRAEPSFANVSISAAMLHGDVCLNVRSAPTRSSCCRGCIWEAAVRRRAGPGSPSSASTDC